MTEVIGLGYLGLHAPDLDRWRSYATEVLGLQVAESPTPGLLLRMDERGWRFAIHQADYGGIAYAGWEVANRSALERIGTELSAAGIAIKQDPALAAVRRVEGLIRCTDPDGHNLEFFYGAHIPKEPFVSPRGVRFVTGDLGLGHIFYFVTDTELAKRFYLDILGFRLSDTITFNSRKVHFAHVNPRHHSLAFVENPERAPSLGHFMLEVDNIDDVGRTLDLVNAGRAELTESLGKHTNDRMVSFFMKNPSGSEVEYGFDGRIVDDSTWSVASYDSTSLWGHQRLK